MAVCSISTHTLLNAWARRMNVPIWNFNQIAGDADEASLTYPGAGVYVQPERELVAEGLINSIGIAYPVLRFSHRPLYWTEVIRDLHPTNGGFNVRTKWRYLQSIGKRAVSLLGANQTVAYTDANNDSVKDTATITLSGIPAAITDTSELQIYFRVADGATAAADERWQIEPLKVSLSGGVATFTGSRALFVKPSLWANPYKSPNFNKSSKNVGDIKEDSNFVTQVDVYRVYPDPTGAVILQATTADNPTSVQSFQTSAAIKDSIAGTLFIDGRVLCGALVYPPRLSISYYAGYPLDADNMPDRVLETAILRLANAQMPMRPDDWDSDQLRVWARDIALYPEGTLPEGLLSNPFGVKVGEVEAWRQVRNYLINEMIPLI